MGRARVGSPGKPATGDATLNDEKLEQKLFALACATLYLAAMLLLFWKHVLAPIVAA